MAFIFTYSNIVAIVTAVLFVTGLFMNIWCFTTDMRKKNSKSQQRLYVMTLNVVDSLVMFASLLEIFYVSDFNDFFYFNQKTCKMFTFMWNVTRICSIWIATVISFEASLRAYSPLKGNNICARKPTVLVILTIIIFSIAAGIISCLNISEQLFICFHEYKTQETLIFINILYSVIPDILMTCCSVFIIYKFFSRHCCCVQNEERSKSSLCLLITKNTIAVGVDLLNHQYEEISVNEDVSSYISAVFCHHFFNAFIYKEWNFKFKRTVEDHFACDSFKRICDNNVMAKSAI